MRVHSPSVLIVGACVMALFPERVQAALISAETATIVLSVIAAVYIAITTLLAIITCWLLCGRDNKKARVLPAAEGFDFELKPSRRPSNMFKGKIPKETVYPTQEVKITRLSSIREGDPYTVAKQQPQQSAPDTTADSPPMQPSSLPPAETKEETPAGPPLPESYLGLDKIFQTGSASSLPSTGTNASDDGVFDEGHTKPEAVAESSFEQRKKQARQKRKAGRTDSTKPLMCSSVSSETGPDTPVLESPDITTTNRRWSTKTPLPPIGVTVPTTIRERPRPGSANTSISTTSAQLPGAMGQTPPRKSEAAHEDDCEISSL